MSIVKSEDSKKWINTFITLVAVLAAYVVIRFVGQIGEWFDLEAKVNNFVLIGQGIGVLVGIITFFTILKSKKAVSHLQEVYDELVKVVWPESDAVVKVTVGILIAVSLLSGLFILLDFIFRNFLELFY